MTTITLKRARQIFSLACTLGLTAACATSRGAASAGSVAPTNAAQPHNAAADAPWADSVLKTLSLRDKAAQMVWVWTVGDYTDEMGRVTALEGRALGLEVLYSPPQPALRSL